MKRLLKFVLCLPLAIGAELHAGPQEGFVRLYRPDQDPNRVRIGPMLLMNTEVEFQSQRPSLSMADPGSAFGPDNRTYDDGFVRIDSTGNNAPPGATSYWGYDSPSQLFDNPSDPTVGIDSVAMHAANFSSSDYVASEDPDLGLGVELGYGRVLGHNPRMTWGLESMFGFVPLEAEDKRQGASGVSTVTDIYSLTVNGILVTAPTAPYAGPFEAEPGSPLIHGNPTRLSSASNGTTVGTRQFDANVFTLRFGPFVDYSLLEQLTVGVGAGLALAFVDSTFTYDETITYADSSGTVTTRRTGQDDDFNTLFGGYAGVQLRYDFTPAIGVYGQAAYMGTGDLEQSDGNEKVKLDFSESLLFSAGVSIAF